MSEKINQYSYSITELEDELLKMRNEGLKRGAWLGFSKLDELWTMKRASTTWLVAPPHAGKSSFINEIIVNLINFSKFKIIIWSPETGDSKAVFNELLWTTCKRPFIKNKKGINATDEEVRKAIKLLKDNVEVLDFGLQPVTVEMIYAQVSRLREEKNFDADLLIIDPLTDLKTGKNDGQRDDIALEEFSSKVRRYSAHNDIHTMVAVHTKAMGRREGKTITGEKIEYVGRPTMDDIAGGQTLARRGMMIVTLWRPKEGLVKDSEKGEAYVKNETVVCVVKAKPKTAGSLGECSIFYDREANRYYEDSGDGKKIFSYECPDGFNEREVSPNNTEEYIKVQKENIRRELDEKDGADDLFR